MAAEQAAGTTRGPQHPASPTCRSVRQRAHDQVTALSATLTGQAVSLYAAAALRIGYGLLYLAFLLREFPHRNEIWGPDSPWTHSLASQLFDQTGWFSILTLSDHRAYFEACYVTALITAVLFMLGWRTRITSILFAIMVASSHARSILMTDGGDNLLLLMVVYLTFTACGRRWSLDARRARLRALDTADGRPDHPGVTGTLAQLEHARRLLVTAVHNCAMFVIVAQLCILYGAAGMFKIQGDTWGNGTALHYVLNLDLFQPWPALSHLMDSSPMLVAVASYLTVLLQVAVPFALFSRFKYVVVAMLLGMHLAIAIVMGLPFFSAAMIIADAVFLPDRFYLFLASTWRRQDRRGRLPEAAPEQLHADSDLSAGIDRAPAQRSAMGLREEFQHIEDENERPARIQKMP